MKTMMLAAMAALTPAAAGAANLGTIPVDPDKQVETRFAGPGKQNWRLNLDKGKSYAAWAWSGSHVTVTVRAAGGEVLARFVTVDDEGAHGGSFRAPYTGAYTVTAACRNDEYTSCPGLLYSLSAGRDCPGDAFTPCGITVGQTLHGLQTRFVEDDDWFGTRLQAGVPYTAQAGDEGANGLHLCVGFRDQRGAVVAGPSCGDPGTVAFTPPASGLYFVETHPGENNAPQTYSLSLSR